MRIRFTDWQLECSMVSYSGNDFIRVTTTNGLYHIIFNSEKEAKEAYDKLLVDGYFDASECRYSN